MTTRSSLLQVVGAALFLTACSDGGGGGAAAPVSTTGSAVASSPEAAAAAFAEAAGSGSGDALLALSCVGREACVREHAAGVAAAELDAARSAITEGVFELAEHLEGAEFSAAVDGDLPGAKDVPYRTPGMTGDAYLTLTFVRSGGEWLYYRPTS